MRHVTTAEVPATVGDGGGPELAGRTRLGFLLFTAACYLISPWLGLDSFEVDPRIPELWPPGGVGFVLLTVVWPLGRRALTVTGLLMVLVFTATALALGHPVPSSLWWGLAAVAQPLLMALAYRRLLSRPGWVPETPRDLAALLGAALGSSLLVGVLTGFPYADPADAWSRVLVWWVLRSTVFCFISAATFMIIFYRRDDQVLPPSSWLNQVLLAGAAVACVYGAYHDPSLPLSWLLIVPSVWGGLTLSVRGTAYLALAVALLAAAMTFLPQNAFGYTRWLPASSIIDLLVTASVAFMLLLTLMRQQRGQLIHDLGNASVESEKRRQVLSTVLDSMTDGVMIANRDGISLYNSAVRKQVRRPLPAGRPGSWVEAFGISSFDGGPPEEKALRHTLFGPGGIPRVASLEVVIGHGRDARLLEVSTEPLANSTDDSMLVLSHDATAEHVRVRELSNFAGTVAHDLRGPLTVLDGWLELLQSDIGESDELDRLLALDRAREASRRLQQVIADWLAYAVAQNGQLHPSDVALESLAKEVVDGYRLRNADGDEPVFVVDLPHTVEADPALLRQVLDNLVGNAVKYTPEDEVPQVTITSELTSEPGWVAVQVSDHGQGIPEGEEEQIFEEFHRGPLRGRSAGTGLGLALTRRIVARHGGQISARRNPDRGSTFTFTLPGA